MARVPRVARWVLASITLLALYLGIDGYLAWQKAPAAERILIAINLAVADDFPPHTFEVDGVSFPRGTLVRCSPYPEKFRESGNLIGSNLGGEMSLHAVSTVASFEEIGAELFPGLEFSVTSSAGDSYRQGRSRYPQIFSRIGRCQIRRDDGAIDLVYLVALFVADAEANSSLVGEAGSEIVAGPVGSWVALLRMRDGDGKVLWPALMVNAHLISRWRESISKRVDVGHIVTFSGLAADFSSWDWQPRVPEEFDASGFFEAVPVK